MFVGKGKEKGKRVNCATPLNCMPIGTIMHFLSDWSLRKLVLTHSSPTLASVVNRV